MKPFIVLFIFFLAFNCKSSSQPLKDEEKLISLSEKILKNLEEAEFEKVREDFNQQMNEALTPEAIQSVWSGLESQLGEFKSKGEIITDTIERYRVVYIICKFEKAPFKLKVAFDDENLVAGLFLIPVNQK